MSVLDVLSIISAHPLYPILYSAALPAIALALRLLHGPYDAPLAPWKYFYSVLVYLSCVPGTAALFFALYQALFQHTNLLALSVFTYYVPIVSTVVTVVVMRKSVRFNEIPGFRTLEGLFLLVILSFATLLVLDRVRLFLFFRASFLSFMLIWIAIFVLLRVAVRLIFGRFRG